MKNDVVLKKTASLCPTCLRKIPASLINSGGDVFLEKICPHHGYFSTIIWRGLPSYGQWGKGQEAPGPQQNLSASVLGCPYDCGLCTTHKAQTCTVLMEVTNRCNLSCPVCFAEAGDHDTNDPDLNEIRTMLEAVIESGGPYPLQISGGEPTVRNDLSAVISLAKEMRFPHVQINTNGIRIAKDIQYLRELKKAGLDLVYMQFDGVTDDVYQRIRGAALMDLKEQAVRNCSEAKIGVQLVPTLIPGVNTHQVGAIVHFAKKWIPVVKGIHFQPVSYFGRFHVVPANEQRVTLPEVLGALELQTSGEIKVENILPRRRCDSHCGFSGFFVLDGNDTLQPTTFFRSEDACCSGCGDIQGRANPSEHVRRFIQERSVYVEQCPCCCSSDTPRQQGNALDSFIDRARTHYLSISGMPFQDVWTIDLERLQGCCIHVISPLTKRLIPFCAYYLTASNGERLNDKGVRM